MGMDGASLRYGAKNLHDYRTTVAWKGGGSSAFEVVALKRSWSGIERGEVVASFCTVLILILDVLHDHFVGDGARGGGKVSAAPEMLPPVLFSERCAFLQELS